MEQLTTDRLVIRPAAPADADAVEALLRRLSPATRQRRWWSLSWVGPAMEVEAVRRDEGVAVLALVDDEVIAIARCTVTGAGRGELSEVVADEWQDRGVGRRLGVALVTACRAAGITRLEATVMPGEGAASLHLFRLGVPGATARWEAGVVSVAGDLPAA